MNDFFKSFAETLTKLFKMQQADPPAVVLEVLAKVLRFGLLALCIAAGVMAVQFVIALCSKKQRKTAVPLGIVCLVLMGAAGWAFLPFSAAPKLAADSAALQSVSYVRASVLAEQAAESAADTSAAAEPAGDAAAGDAAVGDAAVGDAAVGDASSAGAQSDVAANASALTDATETTKKDTMQRTVTAQQELTDKQTAAAVELLKSTKCMRTLRRTLPEQKGQNLLLRLEGGRRWQVLVLPDAGYVYAAEGTGFLCKITDYNAFYQQLQGVLKAA
ncbi:MAG: hypothetical protein RSD62_07585 [Ruthenibacterium sp.]